MDSIDIPNFELAGDGPATHAFQMRGATDFGAAIELVRKLRCTHGSWHAQDHRRVLTAGGGSRAAKHALLAAVAIEHDVAIELVLGIYELDAANTPEAAGVLRAAKLRAILDADCYLWHAGRALDVTRAGGAAEAPAFIHQERITPLDIGSYRLAVFHRYLWGWTQDRGWDMGPATQVHRECVEARAGGIRA